MSYAGSFAYRVRNDASSTNITTSAWVELVDATTSERSEWMEVYNSTGEILEFGVGASGSEVSQFYIMPGGNGLIPALIDSGQRLVVKAVSGNATSGDLVINFWT